MSSEKIIHKTGGYIMDEKYTQEMKILFRDMPDYNKKTVLSKIKEKYHNSAELEQVTKYLEKIMGI